MTKNPSARLLDEAWAKKDQAQQKLNGHDLLADSGDANQTWDDMFEEADGPSPSFENAPADTPKTSKIEGRGASPAIAEDLLGGARIRRHQPTHAKPSGVMVAVQIVLIVAVTAVIAFFARDFFM